MPRRSGTPLCLPSYVLPGFTAVTCLRICRVAARMTRPGPPSAPQTPATWDPRPISEEGRSQADGDAAASVPAWGGVVAVTGS
ncbi:hypothetical protein M2283_001649 [Streptomyces pseudovenezuelae]|uniref:Uncharacterized protein n=1 Tax=Streptomyces pseudovenezuelae TaxID=67350 RepID=A0ABT6LDH6_9ACTN|nr:hypothetical protein [Streptomyces pseudovenezuelae]